MTTTTAAAATAVPSTTKATTTTTVTTTTLPAQLPEKLEDPRIVVRKGDRQLELWTGETLCARYPIALGFAPEGHKQLEGDGRTPEGTYYVCTRNGKSKFYLSLGLSYPNSDDAAAALEDGRIDRKTCDKITEAIDQGKRPPWDTALGGAIMIHGMGSEGDWTHGCIAVENDVMDILWQHCTIGTPVTVLP